MSDIIYIDENQKDGFFDLDPQETCDHPQHDPPKHLYIPPGKGYRHRCPGCRKLWVIRPQQIRY